MHIRLFWKILFSFWLTFICIIEGVWILFSLYHEPHEANRIAHWAGVIAEARLEAASMAAEVGGTDRLSGLLAAWPEEERGRMSFKPVIAVSAGTDVVEVSKYPDYTRIVPLPDGDRLLLRYDATDVVHRRKKPGPFSIPPELLILGGLGGLLFSALLAWYLTAPIWKLRAGFDQLASGDLDARLTPLMGRRSDEITNLAHDFDMMAERMQALLESREQLLHDVSHELRSPLARLHMAVGLARQNPQRVSPLLDRIERESARMDVLVGELLMLSRVETGGEVLDEYFDLQDLACVVVDNARFEAREDDISIELDMALEENAATIRGDAELVRRALENVVRNAIRHSPQGALVVVRVFVRDDRTACCTEVTDSGPGVPEDSLGRIFDPFFRLDNASSPGAGLGLAIARRAIDAHEGGIRAENRKGGGLRISIVLPLAFPEL